MIDWIRARPVFSSFMAAIIVILAFGAWAIIGYPISTEGTTEFQVDRVVADNGDHYVIATDRRAMIIDDAGWLSMKPGDVYSAKISRHFSGYYHVWDEHLKGAVG